MSDKTKSLLTTSVTFLAAISVAVLLSLHLRHAIMNYMLKSNRTAYQQKSRDPVAAAAYQPSVSDPQTQDSGGCGCPSCCAVANL